jgi:hypothetical protein
VLADLLAHTAKRRAAPGRQPATALVVRAQIVQAVLGARHRSRDSKEIQHWVEVGAADHTRGAAAPAAAAAAAAARVTHHLQPAALLESAPVVGPGRASRADVLRHTVAVARGDGFLWQHAVGEDGRRQERPRVEQDLRMLAAALEVASPAQTWFQMGRQFEAAADVAAKVLSRSSSSQQQ